MRLYFLLITFFLLMACNGASNNSNTNQKVTYSSNTSAANLPVFTYEIVNTYPHDPKAFTQGLIFYNGFLYEGTGGRKRNDTFNSSLRKVEIESGKVLLKHDLSDPYFGEGITIFNGKLFQLTWEENTAFVYDLNDFTLLKEFKYSGDGWGLTNDGTNLIMSNGTHVMNVVNPETFETTRTIVVLDEKGKPIQQINELEYIKGEIWANIWQEGWIARIDPASGKLLGRIDLRKLVGEQKNKSAKADVLNGIAYDETGDRIFVTGKLWSNLFEIKVLPKQ